ncbi:MULTISPECIES: DNA-directed RNA polymerase subunit delta [unclassified Bacillus (in: firmicutes)]|uniref:DNA-directed RNA polymerase subunit delta n=1 Tax=unclassified Bacillus (in: firmicutes) TaxID=185979 RepID=UPI0008E8F9B7|nr:MULTISPECIES: DNA-directed RNA polymerase subunit delta [unclassified Bacillus (in: firmicutes)]SFJ66365.1 DNA-directed RNA polymerase subunit delta [Bacillus sp. 71mf]SFT14277.1 DNA-directed RNA polymerase subunit delta [Bacillus sp. 103mf]
MNLKQFSPEELKELSMIEVVHSLLEEKKQATPFHDLVQEIAQLLELSEEQVAARIAQFYTDLNIDGRFINLGENRWGLRGWYPYEQIDEEILPQPKSKKKRKVEEDELDDYIGDDEDFEDDEDFGEEEEEVEDLDELLEEDDDLDDLEEEEDDDDEDFVDEDELEYDESEEEEEEL